MTEVAPAAMERATAVLGRRPSAVIEPDVERVLGDAGAALGFLALDAPDAVEAMGAAATPKPVEDLRKLARPLVVSEIRRNRIEELTAWRRDAEQLLGEIVQAPANGDGRALLEAMSAAASDLAHLHAAAGEWEAAAAAACDAVVLRRDRAFDLFGERLSASPDDYLCFAHASFMQTGRTEEARAALSEAHRLAPDSIDVAGALAHYSLMEGDNAAAREAIRGLETLPEIATTIVPRVDPVAAATAAPEQVDPANFYTYRKTIGTDDGLNDLGVQFGALLEIVRTPDLTVPAEYRALWDAATAAVGSVEAAVAIADDSLPEEGLRERAGRWKFDADDVASGDAAVRRAGTSGRRVEAASRRRASRVFDDLEKDAALVIRSEADRGLVQQAAAAGGKAVDAFLAWSRAIADFRNGRYATASRSFVACQRAALAYMYAADETYAPPADAQAISFAIDKALRDSLAGNNVIRSAFTGRFGEATLDGLVHRDWIAPTEPRSEYNPYQSAAGFLHAYKYLRAIVDEKVTVPLLLIGAVLARLGSAESLLLHGDTEEAAATCDDVLSLHTELTLLSQIVEVPFVKILRARIHLAAGDALYRRGKAAEATAEYAAVRGLFTDAQHGAYVSALDSGVAALASSVDALLGAPEVVNDPKTGKPTVRGVNLHPLAVAASVGIVSRLPTSEDRQLLAVLGMRVPVGSISAREGEFPDVHRDTSPAEPLLSFSSPQTNAALWNVLAEAQARLARITAGLNYLGYRDDYVPTGRFQFLLDRARYFAEHARATRRDYLTFLSNAENEQFRELGAAQAVAIEGSNVRLETARVEQVRLEAESANKSKGLADLAGRNAAKRVEDFGEFAQKADEAATWMLVGSIVSAAGSIAGAVANPFASAQGAAVTSFGDLFTKASGDPFGGVGGIGGVFSQVGQNIVAGAERERERQNLVLALDESTAAAAVAAAQLDVAKQAVVAATLQRSAALLRHDFAVQNLTFLSDRTLNTEVWYRLAQLIKDVSDTYLRYATEMAFLAEQAYEFESDKQLNVIKFDYGTGDAAEVAAADFLLRDLDTLEQDLIVTKREREQHVRCVVSLARDFPEALAQLRQQGEAVVTVPLQLLERRFPGLHNLRIGSVDVMPVALMDPTRFSVQLTYMGTGQVRMRGADETVSGTPVPSWSSALDAEWPVRVRLAEATTVVYSGLLRGEEQSVFPYQFANQRNAFEGYGAACSWHLDMSMQENRIDPRSLEDVLLTLDLSAYYDPTLRVAIEAQFAAKQTLTQHLSARASFPDAFYDFQQSGRLALEVGADLLAAAGVAERVRNVGLVVAPATRPFAFDALRSVYSVDFTVSNGEVKTSLLPEIKVAVSQLAVTVTVGGLPPGATVQYDFGEGGGPEAKNTHTYARGGRYTLGVRVTSGDRVFAYDAEVALAPDADLVPPETARPTLTAALPLPGSGKTPVTGKVAGAVRPVVATWSLLGRSEVQKGDATFNLFPGSYTLMFVAVRTLNARVSAQQRPAGAAIAMERLALATNRRFVDDAEVDAGNRNPLAIQLFGNAPTTAILRPADAWILELRRNENDFLATVENGVAAWALDVVDDVVLSLEYDVTPARGGRRLPPAAITLAPPQRALTVGAPCTVVARVIDPLNQPVEGVLVRFDVQGPNQPQPDVALTGQDGTVAFTYTGTKTGTDTIRAYVDIDENGTQSPEEPDASAICTYSPQPPKKVTLTLSAVAGVVGSSYTATAHVVDAADKPMANTLVVLSVAGPNAAKESLKARTDSSGKTSFTLTGQAIGEDVLTAFADTNENGTREDAEPIAQAKHVFTARPAAKITLAPPEGESPPKVAYTVTATVVDDLGNPVPAVSVLFKRTGDNGQESSKSPTDTAGTARYTYTPAAVGNSTIEAFVDLNGDGTRGPGEPVAVPAKHHATVPPAKVSLQPADTQVAVDSPRTVTAIVVDAVGNRVRNIPVRFHRVAADGTYDHRGVTSDDGTATYPYTPTKVGEETISAFADTNDNGSHDAGEPAADDLKITVVRRPPAWLDLPTPSPSHAGEEVAIAATVLNDLNQPVPSMLVRFKVVRDSDGTTVKDDSGRTDLSGQVAFAYESIVGKETISVFVDVNESGTLDAGDIAKTVTHVSTMPDLIGLLAGKPSDTPNPWAGLTGTLTSVGLARGPVTDDTGPKPPDEPHYQILDRKVTQQSVAAGTEVAPGTEVAVHVKGRWGLPGGE